MIIIQAFGSPKCKSVNYNKVLKECQLIDENQSKFDEEKFEEDDDWIYYGNRETTEVRVSVIQNNR